MAQPAPTPQQDDNEANIRQPLMGGSSLKDFAVEQRMGFVRKVYGILCAQLLLTVIIAAPLALSGKKFIHEHAYILYICLACQIGCMCAMMCAGEMLRTFPTNYIFLFVFTCVTAVMVGFVSAMYTWQSVVLAAAATCLVFCMLTAYAFFTETDFTGFGPYLFAALMVLIVFGLFISIMQLCGYHVKMMMMVYDTLGVMIFCFFIIFDTQCILGEWGGHKNQFGIDDYCFAAMTLYLDIINLFLMLLELFGDRR